MIGTLSPDMGHTELIDTLWNVNANMERWQRTLSPN